MARVYLASREGDDEPLVVKILRDEITADHRALARFMEEYSLVERIQSRHVARIFTPRHLGRARLPGDGVLRGRRPQRSGSAARRSPPAECAAAFPRADVRARRHPREGHPAPRPQAAEPDVPRRTAASRWSTSASPSTSTRSTRPAHGEILGTPRYMSPEQVQGRALDLRTDIYSAGVLLFQMLTGRHLFEGDTAVEVALHHLNTPPPALPDELRAVPAPARQAAREGPRCALPQRRRGARLPPAQVRATPTHRPSVTVSSLVAAALPRGQLRPDRPQLLGQVLGREGLGDGPAAPSAISSSRSRCEALAVMNTTGSAWVSGRAFILRNSVGPSMPGIIQSSITRSGLKAFMASIAMVGSLTTSTVILPTRSSDMRTMRWMSSSSST